MFESDEWDLTSPSFFNNRYAVYHKLRSTRPVQWNDSVQAWLVTRYMDVVSGLRDPHLSVRRDNRHIGALPMAIQEELEPLRRFYSLWLMFSDPPDHTRLRKAVSRAFTPHMIMLLKPYIQETADQLLSTVSHEGHMDVMRSFANPLPILVLTRVLGLPSGDFEKIHRWSTHIVGMLGTSNPSPEKGRVAQESLFELTDYFNQIFAERAKRPGDDLISKLLSDREQGQLLSKEELLAVLSNLLVDGHEPVSNLIGNGLLALLKNPDQIQMLRDDPSLDESAVDELLRFDSPFQYAARRAREDVRIGDQVIGQDHRVLLMLGAANRDPEVFPNPDQLDITRVGNRHCAFGFGPHFCIGAVLGRTTGQIAFRALLSRFPSLRLVTQTPEWHLSLGYRGFRELHISW